MERLTTDSTNRIQSVSTKAFAFSFLNLKHFVFQNAEKVVFVFQCLFIFANALIFLEAKRSKVNIWIRPSHYGNNYWSFVQFLSNDLLSHKQTQPLIPDAQIMGSLNTNTGAPQQGETQKCFSVCFFFCILANFVFWGFPFFCFFFMGCLLISKKKTLPPPPWKIWCFE